MSVNLNSEFKWQWLILKKLARTFFHSFSIKPQGELISFLRISERGEEGHKTRGEVFLAKGIYFKSCISWVHITAI